MGGTSSRADDQDIAYLREVLAEGNGCKQGGSAELEYGSAERKYLAGSPGSMVEEYDVSASSIAKNKMIETLSTGIAKVLGIQPPSDRSTAGMVQFMLEAIPNPRKGKIIVADKSKQAKLCHDLADVINAEYGNVVNKDQTPDGICNQIADLVESSAGGLNKEYVAVAAGVARSINNLKELKSMVVSAFDKLQQEASAGSDESVALSSQGIRKIHELFIREVDRQLMILSNLTNTVLSETDRDIAAMLASNTDFKGLVDDIKSGLGSKEYGAMLAYLLSGVGNVAQITLTVENALKNIGMSVQEYKDTKKVSDFVMKTQAILEKLPPGADTREYMEKYTKGIEVIKSTFGRHDEIAAVIKGANEKHYGSALGGAVAHGGVVPLKKKLAERRGTRELLLKDFKDKSSILMDRIYKSIFVLGKAIGTGQIKLTDHLYQFKTQLTALDDIFREGIEYALTGYYKHASAVQQKDQFLGTLKSMNMTLDGLKSQNPAFVDTATAVDAIVKLVDFYADKFNVHTSHVSDTKRGGSEFPAIVSLKTARNTFDHYYNVAKFKVNLAVAAGESKLYNKDYAELVGVAIGKVLDKASTENNNALVYAEKYAADKATTGYDAGYDKEHLLAMVAGELEAKEKIYRVAQAVDEYLLKFTDAVMTNPEDIHEVAKLLGSVEIMSEWFNEKSGDALASFYEIFADANPLQLATAGDIKNTSIISTRISSSSHYYEVILSSGNAPSISTNQVPPATAVFAKHYAKYVIGKIYALKNIVSAFAYIGRKFGDIDITAASFMTPSDIYKNLSSYLYLSCMHRRALKRAEYVFGQGQRGGSTGSSMRKNVNGGVEGKFEDDIKYIQLQRGTHQHELDLLTQSHTEIVTIMHTNADLKRTTGADINSYKDKLAILIHDTCCLLTRISEEHNQYYYRLTHRIKEKYNDSVDQIILYNKLMHFYKNQTRNMAMLMSNFINAIDSTYKLSNSVHGSVHKLRSMFSNDSPYKKSYIALTQMHAPILQQLMLSTEDAANAQYEDFVKDREVELAGRYMSREMYNRLVQEAERRNIQFDKLNDAATQGYAELSRQVSSMGKYIEGTDTELKSQRVIIDALQNALQAAKQPNANPADLKVASVIVQAAGDDPAELIRRLGKVESLDDNIENLSRAYMADISRLDAARIAATTAARDYTNDVRDALEGEINAERTYTNDVRDALDGEINAERTYTNDVRDVLEGKIVALEAKREIATTTLATALRTEAKTIATDLGQLSNDFKAHQQAQVIRDAKMQADIAQTAININEVANEFHRQGLLLQAGIDRINAKADTVQANLDAYKALPPRNQFEKLAVMPADVFQYTLSTTSDEARFFKSEDDLFVDIIKAMASKVFTVTGLFNMLNFSRNTDVRGWTSPTRMILGGNAADYSYLPTPVIIPEAVELYVRLPLLAEFYAKIFDFKATTVDYTKLKISMAPEIGSMWARFIHIMNEQSASVLNGQYSDTTMREIIHEINGIYNAFKGKDNQSIFADFVAEINSRYGLMKGAEINEYLTTVDSQRSAMHINESDSLQDFDTLDEDNMGTGVAPSDRYRKVNNSRSGSGKELTSAMKTALSEFREKIVSVIEECVDKDHPTVPAYGVIIKSTQDALKSLDSSDERFAQVRTLMATVGSDVPINHDIAVMFHESIITPLTVLGAVLGELTRYEGLVGDDTKHLGSTLINDATPLTHSTGSPRMTPRDAKVIVDAYFDQKRAHVQNISANARAKFASLYSNLDYNVYFTTVCDAVFLLTGSLGSLCEATIANGRLIINHARLHSVCEELFATTIKELDKFRAIMPKTVINLYESNETNQISIRYLRQHMFDTYFSNRASGSLAVFHNRVSDTFDVLNILSKIADFHGTPGGSIDLALRKLLYYNSDINSDPATAIRSVRTGDDATAHLMHSNNTDKKTRSIETKYSVRYNYYMPTSEPESFRRGTNANNSGLMMRFNEVMHQYLAHFWDMSSLKIYAPLIEGPANGVFNPEVFRAHGWPDIAAAGGANVNTIIRLMKSKAPTLIEDGFDKLASGEFVRPVSAIGNYITARRTNNSITYKGDSMQILAAAIDHRAASNEAPGNDILQNADMFQQEYMNLLASNRRNLDATCPVFIDAKAQVSYECGTPYTNTQIDTIDNHYNNFPKWMRQDAFYEAFTSRILNDDTAFHKSNDYIKSIILDLIVEDYCDGNTFRLLDPLTVGRGEVSGAADLYPFAPVAPDNYVTWLANYNATYSVVHKPHIFGTRWNAISTKVDSNNDAAVGDYIQTAIVDTIYNMTILICAAAFIVAETPLLQDIAYNNRAAVQRIIDCLDTNAMDDQVFAHVYVSRRLALVDVKHTQLPAWHDDIYDTKYDYADALADDGEHDHFNYVAAIIELLSKMGSEGDIDGVFAAAGITLPHDDFVQSRHDALTALRDRLVPAAPEAAPEAAPAARPVVPAPAAAPAARPVVPAPAAAAPAAAAPAAAAPAARPVIAGRAGSLYNGAAKQWLTTTLRKDLCDIRNHCLYIQESSSKYVRFAVNGSVVANDPVSQTYVVGLKYLLSIPAHFIGDDVISNLRDGNLLNRIYQTSNRLRTIISTSSLLRRAPQTYINNVNERPGPGPPPATTFRAASDSKASEARAKLIAETFEFDIVRQRDATLSVNITPGVALSNSAATVQIMRHLNSIKSDILNHLSQLSNCTIEQISFAKEMQKLVDKHLAEYKTEEISRIDLLYTHAFVRPNICTGDINPISDARAANKNTEIEKCVNSHAKFIDAIMKSYVDRVSRAETTYEAAALATSLLIPTHLPFMNTIKGIGHIDIEQFESPVQWPTYANVDRPGIKKIKVHNIDRLACNKGLRLMNARAFISKDMNNASNFRDALRSNNPRALISTVTYGAPHINISRILGVGCPINDNDARCELDIPRYPMTNFTPPGAATYTVYSPGYDITTHNVKPPNRVNINRLTATTVAATLRAAVNVDNDLSRLVTNLRTTCATDIFEAPPEDSVMSLPNPNRALIGDPRYILFASTAKAINMALTEVTKAGTKMNLMTTMSEIPIRYKENMKAHLPIFNELFKLIGKRAVFIKSCIKVGMAVHRATAVQVAARPHTPKLDSGWEEVKRDDQSTTLVIYGKLIDQIVSACNTMSSTIETVMNDLNDTPLYLEVHENSITEYKNREDKMPFMPISSMTAIICSGGNRDTTPYPRRSHKLGLPTGGVGDAEYSFNYGTRLLLHSHRIKPQLEHMPGVKHIADRYNTVTAASQKIDPSIVGVIANRTVDILRYINFVRIYAPIVGNNTDERADYTAIYAQAGTYQMTLPIDEIIDLTTSEGGVKSLAERVGIGRELNKLRGCAVVYNIMDLNISPINLHALRREIPLVNIYNYAFTFDSYIKEIIGVKGELTFGNRDNDKQILATLCRSPHAPFPNYVRGTSQTFWNSMVHYVGGTSNDIDAYGAPKFVSDQMWSKAFLHNAVTGEDITRAENYSPATSQFIFMTSEGKRSIILSQTYREIGRARMETIFARNIMFLVNVQRLMLHKINTELTRAPYSVVSGPAVVGRKITDYRQDENYTSQQID